MTDEELSVDVELSRAISEAEKTAHEARLAELQVAEKEYQLLETKLNLDYHLNGEYAFFRVVNQSSARKLIRTMRLWDKHDSHAPWTIRLNSIGGEIQAGAALFDEIFSYSKRGGGSHHITVKVRGLAASMAGILLQAADDRVIGHSSQIMIHESQGGVIGGHSDIVQEADWHRRWLDYMVQIFLSRTDRITRRQILSKISNGREWYLSASEALDYGFVDRIG